VRGSDPATARPGFADMLAAIAADSVRTSIVETPDRFARDLAVQLAGHDHLKRLGVTLIPASAPDHFVGDELQTLIVMPPETPRRQAARRVSLRVLEERGAISLSS
jgi:Resolvase, N terminal domain